MNKETGGPAFPCETIGFDEHGQFRKPYEGMTLRDYFAAKAMQSITAIREGHRNACEEAYEIADAMLKAREA